jgi:hypothetical protein
MADMYAPGWQVTVNGRDATLSRADYTLRAVPIPAGRSRVVLKYRAPGFTLGLIASVVTVIALAVLAGSVLWQERRRKRTPERLPRGGRETPMLQPPEDRVLHSTARP